MGTSGFAPKQSLSYFRYLLRESHVRAEFHLTGLSSVADRQGNGQRDLIRETTKCEIILQ